MQKRNIKRSREERDLYMSMYEQSHASKQTVVYTGQKKSGFHGMNKTSKKTKKTNLMQKIIRFSLACFLLFYVFPYSFHNCISNAFGGKLKTVLKSDYRKLLFPTHSYLYKDLFLGKYTIKDTEYKKALMTDIPEERERPGLKAELINLANQYPQIKPAVYVWEYNGKSVVDINANAVYPAASIIKIPVLIEMFRETDSGKFTLNDSMRLENYYRADGSGKLKNVPGANLYTIDYLAEVMIGNSDNSATNMLIAKIGGMPEINRAMRTWGLKNTRINNWLPDLDGTNVTTAREMAKMLYNLDVNPIISKEAKQRAGYYLSHVANNRLLQAGLPKDALLFHKTGDIGYMLGDAGIVITPSGKKYIAVILAKRPYNSVSGKDFIVKASEIIYGNIAYGN